MNKVPKLVKESSILSRRDRVVEFIETVIYNVAYLRGVFPQGVFERTSRWSTPVWWCSNENIQEYVSQEVNLALDQVRSGIECRITVAIYRQEESVKDALEQLVFQIDQIHYTEHELHRITEVEAVQDALQNIFLRISLTTELDKLPSDCTFDITIDPPIGSRHPALHARRQNSIWETPTRQVYMFPLLEVSHVTVGECHIEVFILN
eukprot:CFRG1531T1